MSIRVLVVDDHAIVRSGLRRVLDAEPDIETVSEAENADRAVFEAMEHKPDIVLMPGVRIANDKHRAGRLVREPPAHASERREPSQATAPDYQQVGPGRRLQQRLDWRPRAPPQHRGRLEPWSEADSRDRLEALTELDQAVHVERAVAGRRKGVDLRAVPARQRHCRPRRCERLRRPVDPDDDRAWERRRCCAGDEDRARRPVDDRGRGRAEQRAEHPAPAVRPDRDERVVRALCLAEQLVP